MLKFFSIIRKFIVALLVAFLFTALGLFSGLGYRVNSIEETSFAPTRNGYANAVFECDMTFNPILYPFYWITRNGQVNGQFSMIYLPDSYVTYRDLQSGDTWGHAVYGVPWDRYADYVMFLTTWGTLPNLLTILFFTIFIEIVGKRSIYIILLCGILGFYAMSLIGLLVGATTACLVLLLLSKIVPGFLTRLSDYLFERQSKNMGIV